MTIRRRLLFLLSMVLLFASCSRQVDPLVGDASLLGTIVRVAIHDGGYKEELLDRVFERVAQIEARMSTSELDYEDTELLRLNRAPAGESVLVSPDTYHVLSEALRYSQLSNGAFDVTIWPLVRLWKIGSGGDSVPPEQAIIAARERINHSALVLGPDRRVTLMEPGMGVDVGAIAKGYAADEAARILREAGVRHALLDFGGNILVIGSKADGTAWRIGVQRPDAERTQFLGIIHTVDRTVVTSGPYERFFIADGVRYHHILDPATGYPSRNGIEQVTIVAERSIDADALSTTAYILGVEAGLALVESLPGIEAVFVTEDREVLLSSGLVNGSPELSFEKTDDLYHLSPTISSGDPGGNQ